ncbi:MAG: FlgD immunoglobulin-like domain containing protein [Candidatus Neomarinimicrobiota bacterium]
MEAGSYTVAWDGTTTQGNELPSGVYIARLSTENLSRSMKMIILK